VLVLCFGAFVSACDSGDKSESGIVAAGREGGGA
jgi:hypothetical protein